MTSRMLLSRPGPITSSKKAFLVGGAFPVAYKGANVRTVEVEELA